jgi:hypothetical protein
VIWDRGDKAKQPLSDFMLGILGGQEVQP